MEHKNKDISGTNNQTGENSIQSISFDTDKISIVQQGNHSEIILNSGEKTKENEHHLLKEHIKHLKEMIDVKDREHKEVLNTKDDEIKVLKESIDNCEKSKKRIGFNK